MTEERTTRTAILIGAFSLAVALGTTLAPRHLSAGTVGAGETAALLVVNTGDATLSGARST